MATFPLPFQPDESIVFKGSVFCRGGVGAAETHFYLAWWRWGPPPALIPVSHRPGLGSPVQLGCHCPDIPVSWSLEGSGAAAPSSGPRLRAFHYQRV